MGDMLFEGRSERPLVLYFEDDAQSAEMIRDFLELNGYRVKHFDSFPENYRQVLGKTKLGQPALVLLDITMPGMDGYEVCRMLRKEVVEQNVPIIFTSGLLDESDILKAYESGGDDYITKPVKLSELKAKIAQQLVSQESVKGLAQQLDLANKIAFKAMATSSELGAILHFNETCIHAGSRRQVAHELIELLNQLSLRSSIFIEEDSLHLNSDGNANTLELKTIQILRQKATVYSWDNRTIFNFPSVSVLIKNMPIDNEERYGELKDIVCLALNGVEARLNALTTEERERQQKEKLKAAAESISAMVLSMEGSKLNLSLQFEKIIESMELNVSGDIIQFNLLQNEEQVLLDHISSAIKEARVIFDRSAQTERHYKEELGRLLVGLE